MITKTIHEWICSLKQKDDELEKKIDDIPVNIYFTPEVSEEGIISWTNNGGLENPEDVDIKGDSIYFTPSIDEETTVLSWTNNGDLENPEPVRLTVPVGLFSANSRQDGTANVARIPIINADGEHKGVKPNNYFLPIFTSTFIDTNIDELSPSGEFEVSSNNKEVYMSNGSRYQISAQLNCTFVPHEKKYESGYRIGGYVYGYLTGGEDYSHYPMKTFHSYGSAILHPSYVNPGIWGENNFGNVVNMPAMIINAGLRPIETDPTMPYAVSLVLNYSSLTVTAKEGFPDPSDIPWDIEAHFSVDIVRVYDEASPIL